MLTLAFFIAVLFQDHSFKPMELSKPSLHLGAEESSKSIIFQKITSISLNDQDILYVLDQGQNQIFKIDLMGKLLGVIGKKGQGPGEFHNPQSLAIRKNYLWVTDSGNGRIQIFKDDEYLDVIRLAKPASPHNVLNLKDEIFISGRTVGKHSGPIKVFEPEGKYLRELSWFSNRNEDKGKSKGLWNSVSLMPYRENQILIGYRFDHALAIIDKDGKAIHEKDMSQFYEKYVENDGLDFPAGYSAMSFTEGPENTILVAVCDQEKRYCGVILRFDQTLTRLLERIDIGYSPRFMSYQSDMRMLILASVQGEIFVYDLP